MIHISVAIEVLLIVLVVGGPVQTSFAGMSSSALPSPLRGENSDATADVIITLENSSLPLAYPIVSGSLDANANDSVSISADYLRQRDQIVTHEFEDGLAVSIPPNLTRASSSALGDEVPSQTDLIDVLTIYHPTAGASEVLSVSNLNDTVAKEEAIDVGVSTSIFIPAQNASILSARDVNTTTSEILSTPAITVEAPGLNTTLQSAFLFNATLPEVTNASRINSINTTSIISIPAQNASLIGKGSINGTTTASLNIALNNVSLITTDNNGTLSEAVSVPAQNGSVIAATKGQSNDQSLNSSQVCEIAELNPAVKSCIPNLPASLTSQMLPTGISRTEGNAKTFDLSNRNVTIAIVDSGVDPHPDLNVVGNHSCSMLRSTSDDADHGTHVAGIAAAKNNSDGVIGVAPGANIYSIKVIEMILGREYGGLADIICALQFINKNSEWIDVVNLSLEVEDKTGDPNQFAEVLKLVKEGVSKNITFVASAGNAHMDAGRNWPALDDNIIIVGSISDSDGQCGGLGKDVELWSNRQKPPGHIFFNGTRVSDPDDSFARSYSNFGDSVDILAPGTNILSTGKNGTYHVDTGTSMASPAVAGAAAVYIAFHPDATPAEVRSELLNKAWRSGDGICYYTVSDPLREPQVPLLRVDSILQQEAD